VNSVEFLGGLAIGLGIWYWSFRRWQHQLSQLIRQFPKEAASTEMPLQVRLIKAVQSQREAEESLQQRLRTWQDVLQSSPIGYLEVDGDDYMYWHNRKAADLLNIELRKHGLLVRRSLLQVVRSYELDQLIESVRKNQSALCRDWTFHAVQNQQHAKDFPIRGYGFPLEDGHVGVFLEDRWEAAELSAERDRWTSDVAHELKTPLTSIRLVAEMLQSEVDPTLRPWMDRLIQETLRLSSLVQDILELSQITFQNAQALRLVEVDLPKLIQRAWVTLEPLAQPKNLSLYYDGPESYSIQADENRLLRVLMNLIDNGIKFSAVDQAIAIYVYPNVSPFSNDTDAPHQGTKIDVIDSGIGFPDDSLSHVFKRFYKADPAREYRTEDRTPKRASSATPSASDASLQTTVGGGSGLGLAIAHQIVTAHGGIIEAKNHPEYGGWISIWLPNHALSALK
jgi:two-component system, OmpR family, phosphate regulon sensor histidine kinase PhoR